MSTQIEKGLESIPFKASANKKIKSDKINQMKENDLFVYQVYARNEEYLNFVVSPKELDELPSPYWIFDKEVITMGQKIYLLYVKGSGEIFMSPYSNPEYINEKMRIFYGLDALVYVYEISPENYDENNSCWWEKYINEPIAVVAVTVDDDD